MDNSGAGRVASCNSGNKVMRDKVIASAREVEDNAGMTGGGPRPIYHDIYALAETLCPSYSHEFGPLNLLMATF